MRKIYLVVVMLALYSCGTDGEALSIENKSIELAAKNSSENVKLLKAWTSNSSSPVRQKYVRRFAVKVKNIAFQKEVSIHHLRYDGTWVDIPLAFQQSVDNNEEIWVGEVIPESEIYNDEFVVKYVVNDQTYWDNNNGINYSMLVNIGAYLAPEVILSLDSFYTRFYRNYFNINVDARRNYGAPGAVEVVYTTDGWATTTRKTLSYQRYFRVGYAHYIQSPNQFDIDKWETSVQVDSEVNTIEYAVVYTTNGQEYWDNNYGENYTITKQN
ncbi:carbohydrate-binding protein [Aquimarina sp. AU474]|uniref:carbohydrate-binding protein n=1 Tax=Aquimarina sp. AU474 TaxID=2108529 RepID=UPI000D68BCA8|nr:carbohydrate-binding protein [Aquimarina sp. AU474]